jgi:hypothetical protein
VDEGEHLTAIKSSGWQPLDIANFTYFTLIHRSCNHFSDKSDNVNNLSARRHEFIAFLNSFISAACNARIAYRFKANIRMFPNLSGIDYFPFA